MINVRKQCFQLLAIVFHTYAFLESNVEMLHDIYCNTSTEITRISSWILVLNASCEWSPNCFNVSSIRQYSLAPPRSSDSLACDLFLVCVAISKAKLKTTIQCVIRAVSIECHRRRRRTFFHTYIVFFVNRYCGSANVGSGVTATCAYVSI